MSNDHKTFSKRMICRGMLLDLVNNNDVEGKFNFLQNIRILLEGALDSRPRVDSFASLNPPEVGIPHTIKTILNKVGDTKLRIVGINDKIYIGAGAILNLDTSGYSGEPLSIVDFRPEASIQSYAYIADRLKMRKIGVDGTSSTIGIQSPRLAATWKLGSPQTKIIDECGASTLASWIQAGSAAAPTDESRINTTITSFLADGAIPGYANIVPLAFTSNIREGAIVKLNAADDVIIEEVLASALNTGVATISKITYDNAPTNTGLCRIVLSIATQTIVPNSILLLGGTEYVRVMEVTYDNNGIPSIRTSTVGTFAPAATVSGASSFRFYATSAYVATNTIITRSIKTVIGASGLSSLTKTTNIDLTTTGTKPLTEDAILHISVLVSDPSKLVELQIQLDIDSTTNDFTKNFFSYVVNPNFFTGSSQQTSPTISVIQQVIQRRQLIENGLPPTDYRGFRDAMEGIDPIVVDYEPTINPTVPSTETELGIGQWTELQIRLGDFLRTGADTSRTLKDVKAIRISANTNAALDLYIDSIWVGKTNELDSSRANNFLAYNYVWRIRDPATKNKSNWSPPVRNGIRTNRTKIELAFPNANADYSVNYKIDIARFGGTLNDFRIVGTVKNDGSTFIDESPDRVVADNELAGRFVGDGENAVFDFFQPFAILDIPRSGVCNVTGTEVVRVSGDNFNISWPRGTLIYINGIANTFYTRPESTTKLSLEKDVGALTNATFEIIDPLMTGQPLPIMFGVFGEGNTGLIIFGAGDKNAAGTLYWLDGNSPDTMSDSNRLELTSPSEPIMAGVIYDGYGFVYTNKRSFMLLPTYQSGQLGFIARENANSRGAFCRTGVCIGRDFIYQISENADGIYKSQGNGNPTSITDISLHNLFYQNGVAPSPTILSDGTIIYPPDFTLINELRLYVIKDHVVFRFTDTNAKQIALIYSERINDWISYDTYLNNKIGAFYQEELDGISRILVGIENNVGVFSNSGNRENLVESIVLPFAFDDGNSRQEKIFDEVIIDAKATIDGISITNLYDNGILVDAPTFVDNINRDQSIVEIENGIGQLAKNITTKFKWLIKSGSRLFEYQYWFIPKNIVIVDRTDDLDGLGSLGLKLWQGVTIDADTFGHDKTLQFRDDFGIVKAILIINHDGQIAKDYSFDIPFISHKIKRTSADNIDWTSYELKYIVDIEPALGKVWEGEISTETIPGFVQMKRIALAYRAIGSNAEVKIIISVDNVIEEIEYPNALNGVYTKEYKYTSPRKGKFIKWRIEATEQIQLFLKDCEVEIKGWTSQRGFNIAKPFGGQSRTTQALI